MSINGLKRKNQAVRAERKFLVGKALYVFVSMYVVTVTPSCPFFKKKKKRRPI